VSPDGYRPSRRTVLKGAVVLAALPVVGFTTERRLSSVAKDHEIAEVLAENPHIRYFCNRRGYIRTRISADELRADFREVPFVSRPGAEVRTGATFVVPDRAPALHSM
jgi:hypothetical protein